MTTTMTDQEFVDGIMDRVDENYRQAVIGWTKHYTDTLIARAVASHVEALKFYATAWDFEHQANGKTFYATPATHLLEDCGKIARQALNADRQEGK